MTSHKTNEYHWLVIGIIPLAGPDIFTPTGVKPLMLIDGVPILLRTLESRTWVKSGELESKNMIFILQDDSRALPLRKFVATHFPESRTVLLSQYSRGALMSALAGVSLILDFLQPIVVDLVDIIYDSNFSPTALFANAISTVGILPYFEASDPKYSYLDIQDGKVMSTVEKQVISTKASAGTYFFKNLTTFLMAASDSVTHPERHQVNQSLFVCPCFNGIISPTHHVIPVPVTNVVPVSLQFHSERAN